MSDEETTVLEEPAGVVVPAFGISADHPRNGDLLIRNIAGCKLRSRIYGMRTVKNKDGDEVVPRDQALAMSTFPETPGMELHVNPAKLTYTIIDPMYGDEVLCGKVAKWMRDNTVYRKQEKIDGLAPQSGNLDKHQMKSLCREMAHLVRIGHATRCKEGGPIPDEQDLEELPGHYLLNSGLVTATTQPKFEKDFEDWVERVGQLGG